MPRAATARLTTSEPRDELWYAGRRAADCAQIAARRLGVIVEMFNEDDGPSTDEDGEIRRAERREVLCAAMTQLARELADVHDRFYSAVKAAKDS